MPVPNTKKNEEHNSFLRRKKYVLPVALSHRKVRPYLLR